MAQHQQFHPAVGEIDRDPVDNFSASMPSRSAGRSISWSFRNGWTSAKAIGMSDVGVAEPDRARSSPSAVIRPPVTLTIVIGAVGPSRWRRSSAWRSAILPTLISDAGIDDHPDLLAFDRGVDQHQLAEAAAGGDDDRSPRASAARRGATA